MYLDELQQKLVTHSGLRFSASVLCDALKRYDLPRLRLNVKAAQQNERLYKECLARLESYDNRRNSPSLLKRMQVDFSRNPLRTIMLALAEITPENAAGWYHFSGLLPPVDLESRSKRKA